MWAGIRMIFDWAIPDPKPGKVKRALKKWVFQLKKYKYLNSKFRWFRYHDTENFNFPYPILIFFQKKIQYSKTYPNNPNSRFSTKTLFELSKNFKGFQIFFLPIAIFLQLKRTLLKWFYHLMARCRPLNPVMWVRIPLELLTREIQSCPNTRYKADSN